MTTLRIQHTVANFEAWKRAFDSDPVDRKGSGVRRYQICRSIDDHNLVLIDLDFDDAEHARGLLRTWNASGEGQAKTSCKTR